VFLRPLASFKIFVVVVTVVIVLRVEITVQTLLRKVLIEVSLDDLLDQLVKATLARHIKRHCVEGNSLPKMIEFASMELDRGGWGLVGRDREFKQLCQVAFQ